MQNNGAESVQPVDAVVDLSAAIRWSTSVAGGSFTQIGADVTVTSSRPDAKAGPGKNPTVTVKGTGAAAVPWLFYLNGKACTSG